MNTPCFVIKKDILDDLILQMKTAVDSNFNNGIIGYSFKTNNLPWLLKYVQANGLWAETVSSDEFQLALRLGFPYNKIIFNGPVKGKKEFISALENGSIVNIDAQREIDWIDACHVIKGKVGLRVNFDLEEKCPGESQFGIEDGRFGFSYEAGELRTAINKLHSKGVHISGLHLHCSSKTRSLNIYKAIAEVACTIVDEYKLKIDYLDVGGGFFGGVPGKPTFNDYCVCIKNIISQCQRLKNVQVILEPGMAIIGASVDYHTTVVDIKNTINNHFVLTDGSRIHIDPLMTKKAYSNTIIRKSLDRTKEKKQTICGFTCMEKDRLFQLFDEQEIKVGDEIIFQKVGAYTMGLAPLFIQFFPEVFLEEFGKVTSIREKWNADRFIV